MAPERTKVETEEGDSKLPWVLRGGTQPTNERP